MHWLRALFIAALLAATATRIWLATRQIAAVRVHRDRVPEYFAGQIALADQQKAADYNAARASFTRVAAVVDALLRLALTLGGGIALADALWLRLRLAQPWHGALVTATVVLAWVLCGLPLAAWRIFQLEERFGF
ncbi:MAG TPA: M48 family peptidase, partial [Gammaproteobacteria bacterium]|nr:M48 family peptidase [Gammaproteobacteria bacterium]